MKFALCFSFAFLANLAFAGGGILFEDFESGSYFPKWKAEGSAFSQTPAKGGFSNQMKVGGYNGKYLVNSYFGRDETVGKITSEKFKIERKFLKCLVGGGNNPQNLFLRVVADGKEVGRLTGINSEFLKPKALDLSAHMGKDAVIEIVDNARGGWGHINIDDICFTDELPDCPLGENLVEIKNADRYILFPINKNAPRRRVNISSPKGVLFNANLNLDFKTPEKYIYFSTREHFGEDLKIFFPQITGEKAELKTAKKFASKNYPNELLRPQYHFSAPQGWLNDPNGMVYWKGIWHLYYQAIPYQVSDKDGHKAWGHAVSSDLMNWQMMPEAIFPTFEENGSAHAVWSGAGCADEKNRSGFFDKNGGLVFAFTHTGKGDYVAHSKDGKYPEILDSPITTAKGRDPCIFYHEPSKKWVVLRYEEIYSPELKKDLRKFAFYVSKDLKEWRRTQILDDFYECPYIISMPANNGKSDMKYLIFDASGECVIGDFDGEIFTPADGGRTPKFLLGDAYAGQIFRNAPNGRAVSISWLRAPFEDFLKSDMPFADMMTLPMDLRLEKVEGKYRVYARHSPEIEKYFGKELFALNKPEILRKGDKIDIEKLPDSYVLSGEFDVSECNALTMKMLGALNITYEKGINAYRFSRLPLEERTVKTKNLRWPGIHHKAADKLLNGKLKITMFIDRSSVEIFHDNKQVYALYVPFGDELQNLRIEGEGLRIESLKIRKMKKAFSQKNLKNL